MAVMHHGPAETRLEMEQKLFLSIAGSDLEFFESYADKLKDGSSIKHPLSTIRDHCGYSPLHAAVMRGATKICTRILKYKVNVDLPISTKSHKGVTALHLVSEFGYFDMVDYLLKRGASHKAKRIPDGWTPLHCASHAGHEEVVHLLISKGADFHASSEHGTPLVRAVAQRKHGVIKSLLEYGAKPNVFSGACTPLLSSVIRNDAPSVKLLLEAGADPNYGGPHGMPLLVARESRPDMVPLLMEHGVDTEVIHWMELVRVDSVKEKASLEGKLTALATEAFTKGKFGKALYYYSEAMSHADGPNDILLSNRALCWCRLKNGEKGLQDAKTLILRKPNWAKGHRRAGNAYMEMGEYGKAVKAFEEALRLDLDLEEYRSNLVQQYQEAVEARRNPKRYCDGDMLKLEEKL